MVVQNETAHVTSADPAEVLAQEPVLFPPPLLHTRWGAFHGWWNRSNKTSEQAEARLLSRLQFFTLHGRRTTATPADSKTIARAGLVELSGNDRKINTLVIDQVGNDFITEDNATGEANDEPISDDHFGFTNTPQTNLDLQSHVSTVSDSPSQKKNLVMCHGYGAGLGFFYRNYHSLSQIPGWRIYAIDWLGMGRSSRPKFDIKHSKEKSIEQVVAEAENFFVDSLEEWRAIHKIEKMTLMGHSLGGYLATVYALKYPERVEKLIMVSPAGIPENPNIDLWKLSQRRSSVEDSETADASSSNDAEPANLEESTKSQTSTKVSHTFQRPRRPNFSPFALRMIVRLWEANITPMFIMRLSGPFGPSLVGNYIRRRFAHLSEDDQRDLHNYLYHISAPSGSGEYALATILAPGAYARMPLIHRMHALKMPTAFIYGQQDWMDYRAAEAAMKLMSVPSKMFIVSNAGHHLYLDNPPEFDKVMIDAMIGNWSEGR